MLHNRRSQAYMEKTWHMVLGSQLKIWVSHRVNFKSQNVDFLDLTEFGPSFCQI